MTGHRGRGEGSITVEGKVVASRDVGSRGVPLRIADECGKVRGLNDLALLEIDEDDEYRDDGSRRIA